MKMLFLIPIRFMVKNKGQTISILLSMVLSVAMIVSVSCLMHSAHVNKTESDREQYGDYHYYLLGDDKLADSIRSQQRVEKYSFQNVQVMEIRDSVKVLDSANVVFTYADENCRDMIRREITKGQYPAGEREIAMDRYTLRSIGAEDTIGKEIAIGEERFILSGIIKEPADINADVLEAFVSDAFPNRLKADFIYLKFEEEGDFYNQVEGFVDAFAIDEDALESNGRLIEDVIDGNLERLFTTIKTTMADEESDFFTLLLKLRQEFHMTSGLVTGILVLFAVFIIYSIFHISTSKRLREYGILQTIGAGRKSICIMLVVELFFLLLISYPVGTAAGLFADRLLFDKVSDLFSGTASLVENTHSGSSLNITPALESTGSGKFYADKGAIVFCAVFMLLLLVLLSLRLSGKIYKKTILEMMKEESVYKRSGKIYSMKKKFLPGVLTNRFMFCRPKNLLGIVLSLSIGGILMLSTNCIAVNSRLNYMMVMHSEEGLSSDVKVSVGKEEKFGSGITKEQLEKIRNLPELTAVSGFQYFLGEIPITRGQLHWKEFWPEIAKEPGWNQFPEIMSRFNGLVTENKNGYKIKTNLYGYEEEQLEILKDYVIDGEIDRTKMKEEKGVILRTLVDALNNMDGLEIKAGDTISVKTPKDVNADKALLRFDGEESEYQEQQFKVLAVVSKSLVNNTEYIGEQGLDIIMTGEQMEEYYQLEQYNMLMIDKKEKDDVKAVSRIQQILSDMQNTAIVDNSLTIQAKNEEIRRAEVLLYSISVLLLVIALFNIMNTMFHLLDARRYSFAVLRAMGITEGDFYKMLVKEAVKYAVLTGAVIVIIYFGIVQRMIGSTLSHVYGYINQMQGVSAGMEILVFGSITAMFLGSVLLAAKQILQLNIVEELKR